MKTAFLPALETFRVNNDAPPEKSPSNDRAKKDDFETYLDDNPPREAPVADKKNKPAHQADKSDKKESATTETREESKNDPSLEKKEKSASDSLLALFAEETSEITLPGAPESADPVITPEMTEDNKPELKTDTVETEEILDPKAEEITENTLIAPVINLTPAPAPLDAAKQTLPETVTALAAPETIQTSVDQTASQAAEEIIAPLVTEPEMKKADVKDVTEEIFDAKRSDATETEIESVPASVVSQIEGREETADFTYQKDPETSLDLAPAPTENDQISKPTENFTLPLPSDINVKTAENTAIKTVLKPEQTRQVANIPLAPGLSLQVARSGDDKVTINLDPAGAGSADLIVETDHKGAVTAIIRSDRQDVLDALRKETFILQKAFEEAGLNLAGGGLDFRQGERGNDGPGDERFIAENIRDTGGDGTGKVSPSSGEILYKRLEIAVSEGALDIRI